MNDILESLLVSVCWVIAIIVVSVFVLVVFELLDFRNDYYCSTTTDTEWYVKHNCMRYERGE